MKQTCRTTLLILLVFLINTTVFAQKVSFSIGVTDYSTSFIPADEGQPELKTVSKYIAIPKDAPINITIDSKSETIKDNVYIAPAYRLSNDMDSNDNPRFEDETIYSDDAFYPLDIITTERMSFRDFDLVLVRVAIERYNPVARQLKTIENAMVSCHFEQLEGTVIHSASPLFRSLVINPEFFDIMDSDDFLNDRRNGCDYLIITPDDDAIMAWADTLRIFRESQGIITKVVPLHDVGANVPDTLKAFLRYASEEWSPAPAATLLLGDYASDPARGVTSFALEDHPDGHHYEPYMADNRLVDFNDDGLPDMVIARMPAANGDEAALMVQKTLQYEREPYTDAAYYAHPITAMGYQRSRWFQLCSEIIAGYFEANGREVVHLNAIHQGIPDSVWSTGQKTNDVINYFGPDGLGYIPSTMSHLTDWNSTANSVTNAIEDGAFMLIHRDHGTFQSWGEPEYNNWFINRLNNEKLTFIMSANCQTGDFSFGNSDNDCLAERFLRIPDGAVGVIAASQLSYSYVNDTYAWGFFDYLFPDFMPGYGTPYIGFQYPAFANAYGKYFLHQSSFPSNGYLKTLTNNLFHYFGDAYLQLFSDVPKHLTVEHPETVPAGTTQITVKTDADAVIALSFDNQLIARRLSNGNAMTMTFSMLQDSTTIKVVATKQNHYRHESQIKVGGNIGVNEISGNDIKIYPNPTTGMLHIEGQDIRYVKIINIIGQSVKDFMINPDDIINLDCSDLPDGVYYLHSIGLQTTTYKFVKH